MRSLRHRERSEVATESINRLCEANDIERNAERNCVTDSIADRLDDEPNLLHSGTEVELSVTRSHLNVISCETREIIIQHEMPNVSFASVGDEETVDFVAYVAKDAKFGRACFVLRCGHDEAKIVLQEIARAFQSRTEWIKSEQGTRAALELEPWFHGSNLSREESELKLINDGDFLVRECTHHPDHFVLSVMHDGEKLHLFFDTIGQVKTKDKTFNNISHLVKNHHESGSPIIANNRKVYLLNGVYTE